MKSRLNSRTRVGRTIGVLVAAALVVAGFATIGSANTVTASKAQYAPVNTSAPSISGSASEGQTLTANEGSWTAASSFAYRWHRCDPAGNACAEIAGAVNKTYKLDAADVGKTIRTRVIATNNDGATGVTSGQTAVVVRSTTPVPPPATAGEIKLPNGETSLPVTSVSLTAGHRLIIADVKFTPNPVRVFSKGPISVRVKVKDNRGFVVRGASVFVRTTPEVTSTPPEQLTGQDGWVTLTMVPQADFPKDPAYNVQAFVRARKSGEDPLGGVSTRRLVQFGLTR